MISIRSQQHRFQLLPQETLLEGLERTGHDVEYQCRSGYCGACRVRLLDGRVDYVELPLAFVAADEILPCCCVPRSDLWLDCELRPELHTAALQQEMFPVQRGLFDEGLPVAPAPSPWKKPARKRSGKRLPPVNNLCLF